MGLALATLAVRHGCRLLGDPAVTVARVATLDDAGPDALSFLANPAYRSRLATTRAGAVVLSEADAPLCPVAALVAANPYAVYARIAAELHPSAPLRPGIHPSAVIGTRCTVPESCEVGPGAVLGDGVTLGERVLVGATTVLGDGVSVGADTRLLPRATLYAGVTVGERCIIHSGAVLGADGFGFARERDGTQVKVPQVGRVRLGNDVEIGASTTVDRGAIGDTVIEDGVKLDNQIQVGHNVRIGAHTVIAAQCGISGSTTIGARCMIGGQAGFAGHIGIADDVVVGGGASVTGSIRRAGVYGGGATPADELSRWRRNMVRFGQLDDIARRVKALERKAPGGGAGGDGD